MIKLKNLLPECEECGRDWNHGHDHEASMAGNELKDAISNASKIQNMIGDNDNLPGWVSSYITLASDYLHSVAEYMAGESEEMSQEPGPGFNMNEAIEGRTFKYKDASGREKFVTAAHADEAKEKVKRFGGDVNSVKEKSASLSIAPKKSGFEEAKKPSAGLTKKEKSDVVKKAQAGKDAVKAGKKINNEESVNENLDNYSNDAITDMIINLSRYEGNEKLIADLKKILKQRSLSKLKKEQSVNEGREVKAIQSDFNKTVAAMWKNAKR